MRAFIYRTLFFCCILILVDRLFVVFKYHDSNLFFSISKSKVEKILPYLQNGSKFDLVVMGSSHAQFGVSPEILQQSLNRPCLNLGFGRGANIGLQLELIKFLVQRPAEERPKTLLFALDVFSLNRIPVSNDPLLNLMVGKNESILDSKYLNSYFQIYSKNIPTYIKDIKNGKYLLPWYRSNNSFDLSMFSSYKGFEITEHGWVKGFGYLNKNQIRYKNISYQPRAESIRDLNSIIELCKENNVGLIIFQIPEHAVSLKYSEKYEKFENEMAEISKNNNLRYLDFNRSDKFMVENDSLFFDSDHLNIKGAEIFSKILAGEIN